MSELAIYVVYRDPSDFPGKYVVRRSTIGHLGELKDAEPLIVCKTLREARSTIPRCLFCITRSIEDDPVIVETWL